MSSDNQILVGFNPNDLYYYASPSPPTDSVCSQLKGADGSVYPISDQYWDDNCKITDKSNGAPFRDVSATCMTRQLCINKTKSDKIVSVQNTHSGADEKFVNTNELYDIELTKTYNLIVGIIGLGALIFYNR
jgi:hypothetical protein